MIYPQERALYIRDGCRNLWSIHKRELCTSGMAVGTCGLSTRALYIRDGCRIVWSIHKRELSTSGLAVGLCGLSTRELCTSGLAVGLCASNIVITFVGVKCGL